MDNDKQTLIMRVMALGVFTQQDRHALRTMSADTLQEIIRIVRPANLPIVRSSFHTSSFIPDDEDNTSDDRLDLINGLIESGNFTSSDQNALWLMSVETLRNLASDLPRAADPIANQMVPPSLGDVIRNRRQ